MPDAPKKLDSNPLVSRLYNTLGAPERVPDLAEFVSEYREVLDGYGEAILNEAFRVIKRTLGKSWPSIKQCVQICDEVAEQQSLRAANEGLFRPAALAEMPWETEVKRAHEWAVKYMRESPLGKEAWLKGYGRPLFEYVRSYARECYRAKGEPQPIDKYRPPQHILDSYSRYNLDSPRMSAWDKHWLIGGPKPEASQSKGAGIFTAILARYAPQFSGPDPYLVALEATDEAILAWEKREQEMIAALPDAEPSDSGFIQVGEALRLPRLYEAPPWQPDQDAEPDVEAA